MQETSLLESRRYKSRLGFRTSPPSPYIPSVMQIIQRNVLTPRFVVSSLKLSREKLLFLLPWWRVSQRATPRRCARAWNRQNTTAWCACTRTRPRSRACVHFHRRARRNCRVAYMQGVKLGSRRFDPRPRDIERSVATQLLQRGEDNSPFRHRIIRLDSRIVIEFSSRASIREIDRFVQYFRFRPAGYIDDYIFIERFVLRLLPTNIPRDKLNLRRNLRHSHS